METENNTQKTGQKPTDKERLQIFMQYLGQPFTYKDEPVSLTYKTISCLIKEGCVADGYTYTVSTKSEVPDITECLIVLKPLERISQKDLQEVKKTFHFSENIDLTSVLETIDGVFLGLDPDWTGIEILYLSDFLRERGYALPYKNWSVEQLEEFGIYKLIE